MSDINIVFHAPTMFNIVLQHVVSAHIMVFARVVVIAYVMVFTSVNVEDRIMLSVNIYILFCYTGL